MQYPLDQAATVAEALPLMDDIQVLKISARGNDANRTVTDLTNRMYFFELTASPSVIWVEMDRLKREGGPVAVEPYDESLVGDITDRFAPHDLPI
ncbi:hypothetical protein [Mycolicibacterium sarraceniae]|uniref:Uncharacterized protein n=1 Tax=Mycolicibacterium sarraceniae TaxID=1534348 RepID=A0A7I7SM15_9MYCO|nr:hypothetical protein [Mycolicibacterium sarraceniae]BBY57570.1 hypothetical protein MSAR_07060 [Mycolicibacterium sarraceniae]